MTEECHRGLGEHAFLYVDRHVVSAEAGENLPQVVLMLLDGPAAYQDVIIYTNMNGKSGSTS